MKKIMLILFSVTMLFTACEKQTENITDTTAKISAYTHKTQIDPAEEFDGITFGMTKEEIIDFHKRQPDEVYESGAIMYQNETYFNINTAEVYYYFGNNEKFDGILVSYTYLKDSEENTFQSDYKSIKEELLIRYPEVTNYVDETDDVFIFYTDNRLIELSRSNSDISDTIHVIIDDMEKYLNTNT